MTLRYDSRSRVSTYTQTWVSNADPDFGAFESIATTLVSSAVSSVTFSSIPQTYKHLQIRSLRERHLFFFANVHKHSIFKKAFRLETVSKPHFF